MGVSSSITVDSFLSFFSYTEGGIVGGSDVDVGDDGIFLSFGWHTKLVVAQRIERGRIKKGIERKREKTPVCVMWGSLSCEVIRRRRRESSPAPD